MYTLRWPARPRDERLEVDLAHEEREAHELGARAVLQSRAALDAVVLEGLVAVARLAGPTAPPTNRRATAPSVPPSRRPPRAPPAWCEARSHSGGSSAGAAAAGGGGGRDFGPAVRHEPCAAVRIAPSSSTTRKMDEARPGIVGTPSDVRHEGAHLLGHALVAHEGPPHARAGVARQLGQGEQHDVLGLGLGDGREVRPVVGQVVHPQAAPVLVVPFGAPPRRADVGPLGAERVAQRPVGVVGRRHDLDGPAALRGARTARARGREGVRGPRKEGGVEVRRRGFVRLVVGPPGSPRAGRAPWSARRTRR